MIQISSGGDKISTTKLSPVQICFWRRKVVVVFDVQ